MGGVAFLFLLMGSSWFFRLVGHSETLQVLQVSYFNSMAFSALPTALVAVSSGFFTGIGKTQYVTWINLVGLVLNVILDYVMIFGHFGFPALGIAGAGYATAIATLGAAIFGFYLVVKSDPDRKFQILDSVAVNWSLARQFLKYGLPSGLQWALEGLAFTVFLIVIGLMPKGEAALAASGIAISIMMLAVLPSLGVAQAVMTLVGQHLGEKKPEAAARATWNGVRVTVAYIVVVALAFSIFPHFFVNWFKDSDNSQLWVQVSELTPGILKILACFVVMDSLYLNISFALKGAGDTRFVSVVALLLPWPLMVLPTYLVREWPHAVYWAWAFTAVYSFSITSILLLRFLKGKWKTMSVIHPTL